jgi:hypothetical protein
MWLSNMGNGPDKISSAQVGTVSLDDTHMGVYTGVEQRDVSVCVPGGYCWRPKIGQNVMIVKCGDYEVCVTGVYQENFQEIQAGEVRITSDGGAEIWLKNDGTIVLSGDTYIEGNLNVSGGIVSDGNAVG